MEIDGEIAGLQISSHGRTAMFAFAGKSFTVRWNTSLNGTALTALRFCIEAAIEEDQLHQEGVLGPDSFPAP